MELVFYLAISIAFARSKTIAIWWFFLSIAAWIPLLYSGNFKWSYFSPLGASACFAAGALLYHLKPKPLELGRWTVAALITLFCIFAVAISWSPIDRVVLLALSAAAAVLLLYAVMYSRRKANAGLDRADNLLADLAYPIFILHWPISVWLAQAFDIRLGLPLLLATLPPLLAASCLLVMTVERPMQAVRERFRH